MREMILNNVLESKSYDFKQASPKESTAVKDGKSFAETMAEIKEQQKLKKVTKKNTKTEEKSTSLKNEDFLAKLKEIMKKNKKEIPAELMSLLQGGSLNNQQKAMLESLMLNLKNNKLNISDLKSLLAQNSESENENDNLQVIESLNSVDAENEIELKDLDADSLEKLASFLADPEKNLSQANKSKLKSELDQLSSLLVNSNSELAEAGEQVLKAQTAEAKLTELADLLKDDKLDLEHLSQISEQKDLKTPVLAELFASQHSTNSNSENAVNKGVENTLFAEISAQMQEMLKEENNKLAANKQSSQVDLNNSDLFSLNSDSVLEVDFGSQELANKNQNNFLELDNSNLNFNFELENQNTANNLKLDNFSLDSENKSQLAENTDLRSQVVEQFRGQYSPETKEMQIQLKPESLGKIDISLAYDNEKLTGKMLVESEIVRAQLENSLKGLKSDLLKQGINIEQFKIETAKNSPQQVEKQQEFAFNDQNSAFSDGETGQNQEFEQRQFFQGQYYVQRHNRNSNLKQENIIMKQQEMINRAAFSNEKLNLLA